MDVQAQIQAYIAAQPEPKRADLQRLHHLIRRLSPAQQLWFLDGKDAAGKTVSNPNIGYGRQTLHQAGGRTRDFYRIGLSANTTGLSLYIIGLEDKSYLAETYGGRIGKASVTGYCIKFRSLNDIDLPVLEDAIRFGLERPGDRGD